MKIAQTEIFVTIGNKVYGIYTNQKYKDLKLGIKEFNNGINFDSLELYVAIRPGGGYWYPQCNEEPCWTKQLFDIANIQSIMKVPVKMVPIYNPGSDD